MIDYNEIISEAAASYKAAMPERIDRLIKLANRDLYFGPLTYDANTLSTSYDDDAKSFPFKSALKEIADWCDKIEDITVEFGYDPDTEESCFDRIDGSGRNIISILVGRELATYI